MSLIRKRKLTKNQTRQIQKNQDTLEDDGSFATGVIVSHFGKQLDVQITYCPDLPTEKSVNIGDIWRCHTRTNLPMLTTGDRVKFSMDFVSLTGRIEILLPRDTLITRPDRYHKVKPVASNVNILAIIFAPLPKPAVSLIDRYLLIAKLSGVKPLLILNKADLLAEHDEVDKIFEEYQSLGMKYGFDIIKTSAVQNDGLEKLKSLIDGKLTIFAGQSGVGKSSLINEILPSAKQSTNMISIGSKLGQHTTTTSRLLPYEHTDLSKGGIIDTPGIREYGIWHLSGDDILAGFDDLAEYHGQCQFRDCNHAQNAKGCALWQAAEDGAILARRILSLNELVQEAKSGPLSTKNQ